MKSLNKSIVLNKIRTDGPISRALIAKETNLTPPTVSTIVKELLDAELIAESEQGESQGGRKPTMLVINSSRFYVIGLDTGPKTLRAVLVNLTGELAGKRSCDIPVNATSDELISFLIDTIHSLVEDHRDKEVIGIGVGMHGVVDVKEGVGLFAPILGLKNIPIKAKLEKEFGVQVQADNDVRVMAFGEYWFEGHRGDHNMVTVNIGHGVGAGIVLNGKLFHGEHHLAGEIGHMTIDLSGKPCSCGNNGCWQTLIAGPAIGEAAQEELSLGRASSLRELSGGNIESIDGQMVFEAANQGDSLAVEVLNKTGVFIGIGLTNLIHMLNPSKIIIGGGVSGASEFILPRIKETIGMRALTERAKNTEILTSSHGMYGTAMGAAALVLAEIFDEAAEV